MYTHFSPSGRAWQESVHKFNFIIRKQCNNCNSQLTHPQLTYLAIYIDTYTYTYVCAYVANASSGITMAVQQYGNL